MYYQVDHSSSDGRSEHRPPVVLRGGGGADGEGQVRERVTELKYIVR